MERHLTQVIAIHPAEGWFEIRGTKDKPILTRVAYWAHAKFAYRDPDSGEYQNSHDIVIGVTGPDIPLAAYDYLLNDSPAGYIHANDLLADNDIPVSLVNNYTWED